jgi:divalent metal cation (Fe/Co/Zn/Cd) transporter
LAEARRVPTGPGQRPSLPVRKLPSRRLGPRDGRDRRSLRHGVADERKERISLKLIAVSFFILAGYVTIEGVRSLAIGEKPESSPVALVLLVASLIVMPILALAKHRVGVALHDNLILADAAETKICVLLSISTLVGVGLYGLNGAAWLDPVAGFIIAIFAIHEGREAWHGELVCEE